MSRPHVDLREETERAVTELVESLPVAETAPAEGIRLVSEPVILVTGFEPFGSHAVNPSQELAKLLDGRRIGRCAVAGMVLPVHHARPRATRPRCSGSSSRSPSSISAWPRAGRASASSAWR